MNHETTTKRIQELTDGMKLEFGCEFMYKGKKCTFIQSSIKDYIDFLEEDAIAVQTAPAEWIEKDIKILGKPITLSHILLASKGVMIDTVGIFYDVKTLKALNIGCAWNLSQNYDGQSEKTKDIIDKIVT